jgi:hypothetical protein
MKMQKIRSVVMVSVTVGAIAGACGDYAGPASGGEGGAAGSSGDAAQPTCGNGVVNSGETCDPPSSCPASCDDGNACTVDQLTGSAQNCNVACTHSVIDACAPGDGCCPSGCDSTTDTDCSASCGNGVVDENETCDPPTSCPTNCNDGNACTVDQLTGSAQNCNATCSHSTITSCTSDDGCCPSSCDSTTDTDCSAGCGNGVVESGETCDPPSSCPTSCDDGNACTVDQLTGTAQNCNVACSHSAISTCESGDGCCPTGCDSTTDTDCSVSCGNGVVESGETCDPPSSCPTSCDDGDPCTRDQLTGSAANCNATCGNTAITACTSGDGCCPSGCDFTNDDDCPGGTVLPCDVLEGADLPCVSAHSTVRVIVSGYTGPLYQVCSGRAVPGPSSCQGETRDIESVDGYADAAAQDAFCSGGSCTISKIYDQSGMGNDLEPAPGGGADRSDDPPANAADLPVMINGHSAYGILIIPGMGYRTGCNDCNIRRGNGTAVGDEPQTMYMVTSQRDLVDGCCFNYGNAETTQNDDGNGTMECIYFGAGVVWGTGFGGKPGPWVMADLENGLYAGWENGQDQNISTNMPLRHDFVTAVVVGDTRDKNNGKGRFALYGGDATSGTLQTMYDGIRPEKPGYVPMQKQGSIELGIGGDNSSSGGGRFYEGVMSNGVATMETLNALQEAIVAARYGQ